MMEAKQKTDSTGLSHRLNPVWSLLPLIAVMPLLAMGQQAEEDIRGAKGLVEIPVPPNYMLWIAVALGGILVVILIWKLIARKRKPATTSASALALAGLERCRCYLSEESAEPLANAVTDVVRRYIDARFGIAAPRKTTEEFLAGLQTTSGTELDPFREDLSRFLRSCDAVKYGRGEMQTENRNSLIESAGHFIAATQRTKGEG